MKKKILAVLLALTMVVTGIHVTQPVANEAWAADAQQISDEITPDEADLGMLDIKMQTSEVYKFNGEDAVDLRVVSSVNGLGYSYVGFNLWYGSAITIDEETGEVTLSKNPTATYKTKSVAERINAEAYKFSPKVVDTSSEYFVTATIEGILVDNFDENFYIEAYCVPLAGAESTEPIYGTGKLFNIEQAKESINIAVPKADLAGTTIDNVTVGGKAATATLAGYVGDEAHLYVTVEGGKTSLPSASKIVVGGDGSASYAIYRNLETDYTGNNADISWYTVYETEGEDEFVIATDADLYGFAKAETNFAGKTVYMVADIDANDGKGSAKATEFTRSDNAEPYSWQPIGHYVNNAELNFAGTFDGQMHTISGVYFSPSGSISGSWGLFGETGVCTIENVILANSSLSLSSTSSNTNLAAIAGKSVGIVDTIKVENDVYVTHTNDASMIEYTGGVVGVMAGIAQDGAKITNCQFSGQVMASDYVGGIIGSCSEGDNSTVAKEVTVKAVEIEHCLNNGKIVLNSNGNTIGGICGQVLYSRVIINDSLNLCIYDQGDYTRTYATTNSVLGWVRANPYGDNATAMKDNNRYAAVMNNTYGISGWSRTAFQASAGSTVVDGKVYSDNPVVYFWSRASFVGETGYVKMNLDFTISDDYTGYWTVTTDVPVLSSFLHNEEVLDVKEVTTPRTGWYVADSYENTDTYILYTKADMYGFASLSSVDFAGKTVKMGADITMNARTVDEWETAAYEGLVTWTPRDFAGTFDGEGHTLQGVYMNVSTGNAGLFATLSGTVQNLRLHNSYFKHSSSSNDYYGRKFTTPLGSIAGVLSGTIDTVYSDATVYHAGSYTGGLVGVITEKGTANTITNSCYAGNLWGTKGGVGGILGCVANTSATITHCMNVGHITGGDMTGALCGLVVETEATELEKPNLTLTDCLNVGKFTQVPGQTVGFICSGIGCIWNVPDTTGNVYVEAANTYVLETITSEADGILRWQGFAKTNKNGNVVTNNGTTIPAGQNVLAYNFRTIENIIAKNSVNLSFQTEGADNTNNYWVAREGKVPMLASFEDLLTNITY